MAVAKVLEFTEADDNSEYFYMQEGFEEPEDSATELPMAINGTLNFVLHLNPPSLSTDESRLQEWAAQINQATYADAVKLLKAATKLSSEMGLTEDEDDEGPEPGPIVVASTRPTKTKEQYAEEEAFREFVERYEQKGFQSSNPACNRIFQDLKLLNASKKKYGYEAAPQENNLYKWDVRLFAFDKDTPLAKDMIEYKKRSGKECVEFSMEFPKDYPFAPPFIRVIRPRFQFRTGHITIGGSVCMELLTKSGWTAANSIESVLICIHSELSDGGGRIDFGNSAEYSEHEAREAFLRVARDHRWET
eukprot:NODE_1056_length_1031_cov_96.443584_g1011_i0.p1 GENE.NODE_1056_length_1031_cov_96.443584_g1011_i0~~NODE_1056_length_1031_cov_96.443584_g1011_i0.p1  ORF type:complete len:332 (+),score=82.62 NODE_1056_length_1031_cov_96.443584_g1011_i0:83-997(+)